jgi:mRNA deadenylase 3'-5' endonuclease subunit Ccr4
VKTKQNDSSAATCPGAIPDEKRNTHDFVLATYNILASAYVRLAYYPRTPESVLQPARRRAALLGRIADLEADLLCLQEVEKETFEVLRSALVPRGISAWLSGRPGRPDGCALLARQPVQIESVRTLAYGDGKGARPSGHIAQFADITVAGRSLVVANTHLKWDPPGTPAENRWSLRQVEELLAQLGDRAPAVICGDLNAQPDDAILERFRRHGFFESHPGRPPTCNSNQQAKTIDYLLVRGAAAVEPLAPVAVDDLTPLPSEVEPSDHVPLLARIFMS